MKREDPLPDGQASPPTPGVDLRELCRDAAPLPVQDTVDAADPCYRRWVSANGWHQELGTRSRRPSASGDDFPGVRVLRPLCRHPRARAACPHTAPRLPWPTDARLRAVHGLPEVLHTLGDSGEDVGAGGPTAPDLAGLGQVPLPLPATAGCCWSAWWADTLPLAVPSAMLLGKGRPFMHSRWCLLGDLGTARSTWS